MVAADLSTTLTMLASEQEKLAAVARSLAEQAKMMAETGQASAGPGFFIFGLTVFILACFVGYHVVWRVTPALHSPLMAVTNAISSVVIVGALLAAAPAEMHVSRVMGLIAVALAAINIFGGFIVTQRMLAMYRKKADAKGTKEGRGKV